MQHFNEHHVPAFPAIILYCCVFRWVRIKLNWQEGFCSSYTMKRWGPGGQVLYVNVSFLNDRISFSSPLIHISLCCMALIFSASYSVSVPFLLLLLLLLVLRGMKYLFRKTRWDHSHCEGAALHCILITLHQTVYIMIDLNMPHYLQHVCCNCRGFCTTERVYLSSRGTVNSKTVSKVQQTTSYAKRGNVYRWRLISVGKRNSLAFRWTAMCFLKGLKGVMSLRDHRINIIKESFLKAIQQVLILPLA